MAEAHHASLVPHNPLSPVMTNAVLNFAAATDNIAICEYPNPYAASTADHLTVSGVKLRQCDMVDHIAEFKDGYLEIPKGRESAFPWWRIWRRNSPSGPTRS